MGTPRPLPSSTPSGRILQPALSDVPVFPLPSVVLFPGGLLPLHVFEPRYVAMVRHALATHRRIVVAPIVLGHADANGNPPIADVAGLGVIVDHTDLPDGRINLVLRGEARVRVRELAYVPPFRRVSATVLPDEGELPDESDVMALAAVASTFANEVRLQNPSFDFSVPAVLPRDRAADILAHYLVVDPIVRQGLLETRSTRERLEKTMKALLAQRDLMRDADEEKTAKILN